MVPAALRQRIKTSRLVVRHRSRFANVFHCTVYRTGSQWMRRLLSDRRVCRYSGLLYEMRFERIFGSANHPDRTVPPGSPFSLPFAPGRIVGLYASHQGYMSVPKAGDHRTFFVLRDPRDIVVSYYFGSLRADQGALRHGALRAPREPEAGIGWTMEALDAMGLFTAMRSWVERGAGDPDTLLLRFEDLVGPRQGEVFEALFAHCHITMPRAVVRELLDDYSFAVISGGRRPGEEDRRSHYRKGVAGDWTNHLTAEHVERFRLLTGDLITRAGYEW